MSTQPENDSKDAPDLGRAGQERLVGSIAPPQVGSNFNVEPTVFNGNQKTPLAVATNIIDLFCLVLPVPGTEIVAAFNYGMSLWGRTAKLICRLPTGGRISYFLKVE